jgi:4-hydroxybenzoate polyprenyltransferase
VNVKTLLTLGRTSNLPTVWSNVLAGLVLSGAAVGSVDVAALAVLLVVVASAFYEGGMFLNDAFDAEIDARERPGRPIPSGQVTRGTVFGIGYGLLVAGLALLGLASLSGLARPGFLPLLGGLGTCAAILVYNRWHKGHAWSPIAMGACRAGLYATAALAVSNALGSNVLLGAGALWLYIIGLTHVARFETGKAIDRAWVGAFVLAPLVVSVPRIVGERNWIAALCALLSLGWSVRSLSFALRGGKGQIPRAVVTLIAGVALVDALFIALEGWYYGVLAAFACFLLTLKWQRRIPGT